MIKQIKPNIEKTIDKNILIFIKTTKASNLGLR